MSVLAVNGNTVCDDGLRGATSATQAIKSGFRVLSILIW